MEIINKENKKLFCEKCQKNSKIYNKFKYLCVECFEETINHKFRANLRTVCKIRHEDYLLICINYYSFNIMISCVFVNIVNSFLI